MPDVNSKLGKTSKKLISIILSHGKSSFIFWDMCRVKKKEAGDIKDTI